MTGLSHHLLRLAVPINTPVAGHPPPSAVAQSRPTQTGRSRLTYIPGPLSFPPGGLDPEAHEDGQTVPRDNRSQEFE